MISSVRFFVSKDSKDGIFFSVKFLVFRNHFLILTTTRVGNRPNCGNCRYTMPFFRSWFALCDHFES